MTIVKFSQKTKIIFGFFVILVLVLSFKVLYSQFSEPESILSQSEINSIKGLLTQECLKNEETSLNKGNNLDEDLEWVKNKAPEFCKCVSLRIYSLVLRENSLKDLLHKREKKEFNERVLGYLKSDRSKDVTDFCLSKAQRLDSNKRMVASKLIKK